MASEADYLIGRLVESVAAVPDPVARANECLRLGDEVRGLHARLAEVRRRAIYEATVRPGATGRSVSAELGVSGKTVSLATSEYRRRDLELLTKLVDVSAAVLPADDRDLLQARALLADSSSVGATAAAVARLADSWVLSEEKRELTDDEWWDIHDGFERAEYLASLAGLGKRNGFSKQTMDSDDRTPELLRWICRVFNAMPGIRAWGDLHEAEGEPAWSVYWSIASSDRNVDIFDAGPSREGWLLSEWVAWLARDYRMAGEEVEVRVTAPPPYLNHPGNMLSFILEAPLAGPRAVSPDRFANDIIRFWEGTTPEDRTGYFDVEWPSRGRA
jgi:hypothetical protein